MEKMPHAQPIPHSTAAPQFIGSSVPRRPPFVWSQRKSRPFALISRSRYRQRSAWDLVPLRAQLGLWRKCLTLVDGYIWHHTARNVRQDPPASGIRRALSPDSDLECQSALPKNSAGRERLVRLSHNTAGRDINITSFQSGPGELESCHR